MFIDAAIKMLNAYPSALMDEWSWDSGIPLQEPIPDFDIDRATRAGKIPPTTMAYGAIAPFQRLFSFNPKQANGKTPTFVIAAPNSGTPAEHMIHVVHGLLAQGFKVRLIQQRDPHYVSAIHQNSMDDSTLALVKALEMNPQAYVMGFSQSGVTVMRATAYMTQTPALEPAAPKGIIIIGSPINPDCDPAATSWAANFSTGVPLWNVVGPRYTGAWAPIVSAHLMKSLFNAAANEAGVDMAMQRQDLTLRHTIDMLEHFRHGTLRKGYSIVNNRKVTMRDFKGCAATITGRLDTIVPEAQTNWLLDDRQALPQASFKDKLSLPCGHYGLVSEEITRRELLPFLAGFIAANEKRLRRLAS